MSLSVKRRQNSKNIYVCTSIFLRSAYILSSFLSVLLKCLACYSGRQSICWCYCASFNSFCWSCLLHFIQCTYISKTIYLLVLLCAIQLFLLVLPFTFHSMYISKTIYLLVLCASFNYCCWSCLLHFILCVEARQSICWCHVQHSTIVCWFCLLQFILCVEARQSICWCHVRSIQLFLLVLSFTHREGVYLNWCVRQRAFIELVYFRFFFILSKCIYIIAAYNGRQSICWCYVHNSALFAGLRFYIS